jgi:hypothetical protein
MRALIVFESMYGNTHTVADEIARGLSQSFDEVPVVSAHDADYWLLDGADLVVVGGPTHVHSMTSPKTRAAAAEAAEKDDDLELEDDATGPGLREWFESMERSYPVPAAAFDTRIGSVPAVVSGRASKGIARRLRKHGFEQARPPESFLVDKHNRLLDGEAERARQWGDELARATASSARV